MNTNNTHNKGKLPFPSVAETHTNFQAKTHSLRLPAIVLAAAALCAASCTDSASNGNASTTPNSDNGQQPTSDVRIVTLPDGTQETIEKSVAESQLPDPVARVVEKDQNGARWIKIFHDPTPYKDGTTDTTGLLREYAYINLDKNEMMSQERFDESKLKLQLSEETVYWHSANKYAFDGFWSDKADLNKEEVLRLHQQTIDGFMADTSQNLVAQQHNPTDTAQHAHGASGDWSNDKPQTAQVNTNNGGHGGYIFYRSYYPYNYGYGYGYYDDVHYSSSSKSSVFKPEVSKTSNLKSSISKSATFKENALSNKSAISEKSTTLRPFNRFTTTNLFRANRGLSVSERIGPRSTSFHFSTGRSPTIRGVMGSRGGSFGA